ncbi:mCG117216 [Mus musculus]|nr:mCG117216 [Mus musculus]
MCAEGSCSSVVLPGQLSARKSWCRNPGQETSSGTSEDPLLQGGFRTA